MDVERELANCLKRRRPFHFTTRSGARRFVEEGVWAYEEKGRVYITRVDGEYFAEGKEDDVVSIEPVEPQGAGSR